MTTKNKNKKSVTVVAPTATATATATTSTTTRGDNNNSNSSSSSRSKSLLRKGRHSGRGGYHHHVSEGFTRSVTLIDQVQLSQYSAERFYLLSEIEQHGHSTHFLSLYPALSMRDPIDYKQQQRTEEEEDNHTAATSLEDEEDLVDQQPKDNKTDMKQDEDEFPHFLILYVLWRPSMPSDPEQFCDEVLLDCVDQLEELVDLVHSSTTLLNPENPYSIVGPNYNSHRRNRAVLEDSEEDWVQVDGGCDAESTVCLEDRGSLKSSLYLVIDRVVEKKLHPDEDPDDDDDSDADDDDDDDTVDAQEIRDMKLQEYKMHYEILAQQAEDLTRYVASHARLRHLCEGITICLADHERAAPGLEVCCNAMLLGSKDRRPMDNNKSLVGLVTLQPEDFWGLQSENPHNNNDSSSSSSSYQTQIAGDTTTLSAALQRAALLAGAGTDAVQDVWQYSVSAEWNGMGSIRSFACRAHKAWRMQHKLEPLLIPDVPPRKKVKRVRRKRELEYQLQQEELRALVRQRRRESLVNRFGAVVVVFYILFHYGRDISYLLDPNVWTDLILTHLR